MARWLRFVLASVAVVAVFFAAWFLGELVLDRETAQALGGLASAVTASIGYWWAALDRAARPVPATRSVHQVGLVPNPAEGFRRRSVADDLDAAVAAGGTVILSGLGGVGKTQIAAELARRLRAANDVDVLVWINATGAESIEAGYAQAGRQVLGGDDNDRRGDAVRFVAWLATTDRRWLVVLDDVAEPAHLSGWWPSTPPGGRVVVTTRRRDSALAGRGRLLTVGPFDAVEARAYLTGKLGDRSDRLAEADELAADLGFLPLALAQAAAYIIDRDLACAEYRALLADRRRGLAEVTPEQGALPDEHDRPVASTWTMSVDLGLGADLPGLSSTMIDSLTVRGDHD